MSNSGLGGEADSLEPDNFKSLFGLSFLAPTGVFFGGIDLYMIAVGKHIHSPVLGIVAIIWCVAGGVLLAVFTVRNLFPDFDRSRDALLGWLQLPRTKRYLARVDRGDSAVLFSPLAIHKLRTLNRICMVLLSVALIASTVNLVVTDFLPALSSDSTGSDLGALVVIGLPLMAYVVSRCIRLWVLRDSIRRSGQLKKGGY
jgi:hypothetical protein